MSKVVACAFLESLCARPSVPGGQGEHVQSCALAASARGFFAANLDMISVGVTGTSTLDRKCNTDVPGNCEMFYAESEHNGM